MPSTFSWMDYSERERQEALDVIDLFQEEDTRDELGLGVVWIALADYLFPGTSTIQTRIKYFLFIPWILQDLEQRCTPSAEMPLRSRKLQGKMRDSLVQGGQELGVIGYRAGINVQRLPSSIYWFGLRRWGILRYSGTEDEYYRSLDTYHRLLSHALRSDDGEPVDDRLKPNWDPHLPPPPGNLLDRAAFTLSPEESDYLIHRIETSAPNSLLAFLISQGTSVAETSEFPWDHVSADDLPTSLAVVLKHSRNFSEAMHGAALLYNLRLAEDSERHKLVDEYRIALAEWWDQLKKRDADFWAWDLNSCWSLIVSFGARLTIPTRNFVDTWWAFVRKANKVEDIIGDPRARLLIQERERYLKKGRARIGNPRAIELWTGAAGTARLDYRWNRPVRTMLNDLLKPQKQEKR